MGQKLQLGERPHINYDFYTELAKSLHTRGGSSKKRAKILAKTRAMHERASSALGRAFYYEGVAEVSGDSDTEEADLLMEWVLRELKGIANPTPQNTEDLREVAEVLADW